MNDDLAGVLRAWADLIGTANYEIAVWVFVFGMLVWIGSDIRKGLSEKNESDDAKPSGNSARQQRTPWWWGRDRRIFKAHAPLVERVRTVTEQTQTDSTRVQETINAIAELKEVLDRLGVPCPSGNFAYSADNALGGFVTLSFWISTWSVFAALLLPQVVRGDLKRARTGAALNAEPPFKPVAQWRSPPKVVGTMEEGG